MKFETRRINEWLIVVLGFIIVMSLFSLIRGDVYILPDNIHYIFNTHPTTIILGLDTVNAIDIFGGREPEGYPINWKTASMLLNVVLYLMIGPFLLYMGYKEARKSESYTKPWYWFVGGMIFIGSLTIIPTETLKIRVFQNTKVDSEKSRVHDKMRAELAEVGFATAMYEYLEDGLNEDFQVEDLGLERLNYQYEVVSILSDTLVVIKSSYPEYTEFTGKMEIRPYSQRLMVMRN